MSEILTTVVAAQLASISRFSEQYGSTLTLTLRSPTTKHEKKKKKKKTVPNRRRRSWSFSLSRSLLLPSNDHSRDWSAMRYESGHYRQMVCVCVYTGASTGQATGPREINNGLSFISRHSDTRTCGAHYRYLRR